MTFTTDGIVLRASPAGESDLLVVLLTGDRGVVSAFAKSARRPKNKLHAGSCVFSYGSFTFFEGSSALKMTECEPLENFFDLRNDIEALALAQYFCELAGELAPVEDDADEFLRLILNALHMLMNKKRPQAQLKAVVELRLLCLSGYMPDLVVCGDCGEEYDGSFLFSPVEGLIFCEKCRHKHSGVMLTPGVLRAMRHICYSEDEKLFSFTLGEDSMKMLSEVTERFLLTQTSKKFKTLDFYKAMAISQN